MNEKDYLKYLTEGDSNLVEDSEVRQARMQKMKAKAERELAKDEKWYNQNCVNVDKKSIVGYQCGRTKERIKSLKYDLRAMRVVHGVIGGVDKTIDKIRGKGRG